MQRTSTITFLQDAARASTQNLCEIIPALAQNLRLSMLVLRLQRMISMGQSTIFSRLEASDDCLRQKPMIGVSHCYWNCDCHHACLPEKRFRARKGKTSEKQEDCSNVGFWGHLPLSMFFVFRGRIHCSNGFFWMQLFPYDWKLALLLPFPLGSILFTIGALFSARKWSSFTCNWSFLDIMAAFCLQW